MARPRWFAISRKQTLESTCTPLIGVWTGVYQPGTIRNASPLKSSYGVLRASATRRTASRAVASVAPEPRGAARRAHRRSRCRRRGSVRSNCELLVTAGSSSLSARFSTRSLAVVVSGSGVGRRVLKQRQAKSGLAAIRTRGFHLFGLGSPS
jgi:hypothetical protein